MEKFSGLNFPQFIVGSLSICNKESLPKITEENGTYKKKKDMETNMKQTFLVCENAAGTRIDVFLKEACPDLSRSFLQKLLKSQDILVKGVAVKANYKVAFGDKVEITIPAATEPEIIAEPMDLDIIYESYFNVKELPDQIGSDIRYLGEVVLCRENPDKVKIGAIVENIRGEIS